LRFAIADWNGRRGSQMLSCNRKSKIAKSQIPMLTIAFILFVVITAGSFAASLLPSDWSGIYPQEVDE
jgi:hypothetical protein